MHDELTADDGDFRHLRQVTRITLHQRHALVAARRRLAPSGAFGRELEYAPLARLVGKLPHSKIVRVHAGGRRELIHEAFDHEAIRRVAHGAHVAHIDADFLPRIAHREIRHIVEIIDRGLDHRVVDALDRRKHAFGDRGTGDVQFPGDHFPGRVDAAADLFVCRRTVGVMSHVIFARPNDLDGHADRLRGFDRRGNEIDVQAPAEAAADQGGMDPALGPATTRPPLPPSFARPAELACPRTSRSRWP